MGFPCAEKVASQLTTGGTGRNLPALRLYQLLSRSRPQAEARPGRSSARSGFDLPQAAQQANSRARLHNPKPSSPLPEV